MKAMNFQDDITSIPIDNFKDHYVLLFDLTSMQDATENFHYRHLVGEPLRLELTFIHPLEPVTELFLLGKSLKPFLPVLVYVLHYLRQQFIGERTRILDAWITILLG